MNERFKEFLENNPGNGSFSPFGVMPHRGRELRMLAQYGEVEYPEENNFDLRILIQKRIYEGKIK